MYLGHQNIFQLSIIWLAVFHLKIVSVKHLATVNFFFIKTEAVEVLNTGISLYHQLFAFLLFNIIVLYFTLSSFPGVFVVSCGLFCSLIVITHFAC